MEFGVFLVRIRQRHGPLRSAFVTLDEHHQLAKHLAQIAAVDFVDDEDEVCVAVAGFLAKCMKRAVAQRESGAIRAETLDEVLVGVRGVKLDHLDPFVRFAGHQGVSQATGEEGLSHAGRALQDEILLGAQALDDAAEVRAVDEQAIDRFIQRVGHLGRLFVQILRLRLRDRFGPGRCGRVCAGRRHWSRSGVVVQRLAGVFGLETPPDDSQDMVKFHGIQRADVRPGFVGKHTRDEPAVALPEDAFEVVREEQEQQHVPELACRAVWHGLQPPAKFSPSDSSSLRFSSGSALNMPTNLMMNTSSRQRWLLYPGPPLPMPASTSSEIRRHRGQWGFVRPAPDGVDDLALSGRAGIAGA